MPIQPSPLPSTMPARARRIVALKLAIALFVTDAASSSCSNSHHNPRDDDDDGDGYCSTTSFTSATRGHNTVSSSAAPSGMSQSSAASSATLPSLPSLNGSQRGLSRGGVAGLTIAIMVILFAIILLVLYWRRKLRKERVHAEEGEKYRVGTSTQMANNSSLSGRETSQQPRSDHTSWPGVPLLANHSQLQEEQQPYSDLYTNLQRAPSVSSLPNPYDAYITDRDLPPVPADESFLSPLEPTQPHTSSSTRPSYSYAAVLARGSTQASTASGASAASNLLSEMASYQKRLEAHHEKELQAQNEEGETEERVQIASSSLVPADPPPLYQEDAPSSSANTDLGHDH